MVANFLFHGRNNNNNPSVLFINWRRVVGTNRTCLPVGVPEHFSPFSPIFLLTFLCGSVGETPGAPCPYSFFYPFFFCCCIILFFCLQTSFRREVILIQSLASGLVSSSEFRLSGRALWMSSYMYFWQKKKKKIPSKKRPYLRNNDLLFDRRR